MGREWCVTVCKVTTCVFFYFHAPWAVVRISCGTLCSGPRALLYSFVPWLTGRKWCGTLCRVTCAMLYFHVPWVVGREW